MAATAGCADKGSVAAAPSAATPKRVPAFGGQQAGVTRPALPQSQLISQVYDVHGSPGPLLRQLGELIVTLTSKRFDDVVDPADLTVTVGVGPRLVRSVDPSLPGAEALPAFAGEEIEKGRRGGDLWVQVCGSDPLATGMAAVRIQEQVAADAKLLWSQRGWRGAYEPTPDGNEAGRNLQGFQDGIVQARSDEELREGVWMASPPALKGSTIAVVRRFRIDLAAWRAMGLAGQEAAVGRKRDSSMTLSGGPNVDLGAKTPDGRYKIPADAHVRRAHPLDAGVPVMLRRSYSIDDPEPGLLFVSFQNQLRTFAQTMQRLVESDRMISFTTTTATGSFLVLPGATAAAPLGSTLFHTVA